jgi:hypothetical protein
MTKAHKIKLVARARLHGAHYAWRTIDEADKHGIGPALAMAVIQKETGFRNVFGHDDVANPVKSPPGRRPEGNEEALSALSRLP